MHRFWGPDYTFSNTPGVRAVTVGYAGGVHHSAHSYRPC